MSTHFPKLKMLTSKTDLSECLRNFDKKSKYQIKSE